MRKAQLKDTQERRKRRHRTSSKALVLHSDEQQRPASNQNVDAADAGGGPSITPSLKIASRGGGTMSMFGQGGDDDEASYNIFQTRKNVLVCCMYTLAAAAYTTRDRSIAQ